LISAVGSRRPAIRSIGEVATPAVFVLALLLAAPAAHGQLVGEFNARLKGVKLWGAYTAVLESRVYETDGSPPPDLERAEIHFPRGAGIRERFLRPEFYCDAAKLAATQNPSVCRHAHFGSGKMLLDGRPWIADDVHADIDLYLGRAAVPGALAAAVVLVHSNQQSHAYDFQVLGGNLFRDSGRFGYRLELPTKVRPILPTVKLRLAELSLTLRGLRTVVHGRKLFWTKVPPCPRARRVSFGADYEFEGKAPIRKRRRINCRRFVRRPAVERHGRIPGAST
jgi:hypothetical protein